MSQARADEKHIPQNENDPDYLVHTGRFCTRCEGAFFVRWTWVPALNRALQRNDEHDCIKELFNRLEALQDRLGVYL